MRTSPPPLAPIFRSSGQLAVLTVLFGEPVNELTIAKLSESAGVSHDTAGREVARLAEYGIVITKSIGRTKVVEANWALPWARDLRSLLLKTVGVLGQLSQALSEVKELDSAYIFGSWARRFVGESGPPPHDVDVLVVGAISLRAVRRAIDDLEVTSFTEINPVVVTNDRWDAKPLEPFLAQIKADPLVEIPLRKRPLI